jgi:DNA gyrase inhibitor GyrI
VSVAEPKFTTVIRDGDFQIRDYPALTVAEVRVPGGQWGAANRGFRLLAHYIFGGNARQQKIEMTAPVTQQKLPTSERRDGDAWIVRFIMPDGFTPATLPPPDDEAVRLLALPPTRTALVRFSGWALPFIVRSETARLKRWMAQRQLQPTGPVTLAQYDPPWTIWFLRRNEVMAPIAP